jgi:hypothetical protein
VEFKYCFILQLLEPLFWQPELQSQLLLELLFHWDSYQCICVYQNHQNPSTIAAVTKVKILSIDLKHHHLMELRTLLHEDQS